MLMSLLGVGIHAAILLMSVAAPYFAMRGRPRPAVNFTARQRRQRWGRLQRVSFRRYHFNADDFRQ